MIIYRFKKKKEKTIFYLYKTKNNKVITNRNILKYINKLYIPPAYDKVEIYLDPSSNIAATGIDSKNRKQYIYKKQYIEKSRKQKYYNLIEFGKQYNIIMNDINNNLNQSRFTKNAIIGIILKIMMECNFRVGNEKYRDLYNTYGTTTLLNKMVHFKKNGTILISFIGKKGVINKYLITKNSLIDLLKKFRRRNGDKRFFYYIENNKENYINSYDINEYLSKFGSFTSKEFRTWKANMLFLQYLLDYINNGNDITEYKNRNKCIKNIVEFVAQQLHHTPAISKKSYINSDLIKLFTDNIKQFLILKKNKYRKTKKNTKLENLLLNYLIYLNKIGK